MHEHTKHIRPRHLLALAVVPALGVAVAASGDGATAEAARSRRLEVAFEQQPATIGAPVCSPATSCVIPYSVVGTTSGDFEGSTVQAGGSRLMPDGSAFGNATLSFTGTVAGCGTGQVTSRSSGFRRGDSVAGWSIEIIGGTGGLADLSGSGTITSGRIDPATGVVTGVIEYKVKC